MAEVKIYSTDYCPYCRAAESLFRAKNVAFEAIDVTEDADARRWLVEATGQRTVPQIFINGRSIGGYSDARELDRRGELDRLLQGAAP